MVWKLTLKKSKWFIQTCVAKSESDVPFTPAVKIFI